MENHGKPRKTRERNFWRNRLFPWYSLVFPGIPWSSLMSLLLIPCLLAETASTAVSRPGFRVPGPAICRLTRDAGLWTRDFPFAAQAFAARILNTSGALKPHSQSAEEYRWAEHAEALDPVLAGRIVAALVVVFAYLLDHDRSPVYRAAGIPVVGGWIALGLAVSLVATTLIPQGPAKWLRPFLDAVEKGDTAAAKDLLRRGLGRAYRFVTVLKKMGSPPTVYLKTRGVKGRLILLWLQDLYSIIRVEKVFADGTWLITKRLTWSLSKEQGLRFNAALDPEPQRYHPRLYPGVIMRLLPAAPSSAVVIDARDIPEGYLGDPSMVHDLLALPEDHWTPQKSETGELVVVDKGEAAAVSIAALADGWIMGLNDDLSPDELMVRYFNDGRVLVTYNGLADIDEPFANPYRHIRVDPNDPAKVLIEVDWTFFEALLDGGFPTQGRAGGAAWEFVPSRPRAKPIRFMKPGAGRDPGSAPAKTSGPTSNRPGATRTRLQWPLWLPAPRMLVIAAVALCVGYCLDPWLGSGIGLAMIPFKADPILAQRIKKILRDEEIPILSGIHEQLVQLHKTDKINFSLALEPHAEFILPRLAFEICSLQPVLPIVPFEAAITSSLENFEPARARDMQAGAAYHQSFHYHALFRNDQIPAQAGRSWPLKGAVLDSLMLTLARYYLRDVLGIAQDPKTYRHWIFDAIADTMILLAMRLYRWSQGSISDFFQDPDASRPAIRNPFAVLQESRIFSLLRDWSQTSEGLPDDQFPFYVRSFARALASHPIDQRKLEGEDLATAYRVYALFDAILPVLESLPVTMPPAARLYSVVMILEDENFAALKEEDTARQLGALGIDLKPFQEWIKETLRLRRFDENGSMVRLAVFEAILVSLFSHLLQWLSRQVARALPLVTSICRPDDFKKLSSEVVGIAHRELTTDQTPVDVSNHIYTALDYFLNLRRPISEIRKYLAGFGLAPEQIEKTLHAAAVKTGVPYAPLKILAVIVMVGAWLLDYYRSPGVVMSQAAMFGGFGFWFAASLAMINYKRRHVNPPRLPLEQQALQQLAAGNYSEVIALLHDEVETAPMALLLKASASKTAVERIRPVMEARHMAHASELILGTNPEFTARLIFLSHLEKLAASLEAHRKDRSISLELAQDLGRFFDYYREQIPGGVVAKYEHPLSDILFAYIGSRVPKAVAHFLAGHPMGPSGPAKFTGACLLIDLVRWGYGLPSVAHSSRRLAAAPGTVKIGFLGYPGMENLSVIYQGNRDHPDAHFMALPTKEAMPTPIHYGRFALQARYALIFRAGKPVLATFNPLPLVDYLACRPWDYPSKARPIDVATGGDPRRTEYLGQNHVAASIFDKKGVPQPPWMALDVSETPTPRIAARRKGFARWHVLHSREPDLPARTKQLLAEFFQQHSAAEVIVKPVSGYGGEGVLYVNPDNLDEMLPDIVAPLTHGASLMVQERIISPLDSTIRVFVTADPKGKVRMFVRHGPDGKPAVFEEWVAKWKLNSTQTALLKKDIERVARHAVRAVAEGMNEDLLRESKAGLGSDYPADWTGVDMIVRDEHGTLKPYVIGIKGDDAAGMGEWDALMRSRQPLMDNDARGVGDMTIDYTNWLVKRARGSDRVLALSLIVGAVGACLLDYYRSPAVVISHAAIFWGIGIWLPVCLVAMAAAKISPLARPFIDMLKQGDIAQAKNMLRVIMGHARSFKATRERLGAQFVSGVLPALKGHLYLLALEGLYSIIHIEEVLTDGKWNITSRLYWSYYRRGGVRFVEPPPESQDFDPEAYEGLLGLLPAPPSTLITLGVGARAKAFSGDPKMVQDLLALPEEHWEKEGDDTGSLFVSNRGRTSAASFTSHARGWIMGFMDEKKNDLLMISRDGRRVRAYDEDLPPIDKSCADPFRGIRRDTVNPKKVWVDWEGDFFGAMAARGFRTKGRVRDTEWEFSPYNPDARRTEPITIINAGDKRGPGTAPTRPEPPTLTKGRDALLGILLVVGAAGAAIVYWQPTVSPKSIVLALMLLTGVVHAAAAQASEFPGVRTKFLVLLDRLERRLSIARGKSRRHIASILNSLQVISLAELDLVSGQWTYGRWGFHLRKPHEWSAEEYYGALDELVQTTLRLYREAQRIPGTDIVILRELADLGLILPAVEVSQEMDILTEDMRLIRRYLPQTFSLVQLYTRAFAITDYPIRWAQSRPGGISAFRRDLIASPSENTVPSILEENYHHEQRENGQFLSTQKPHRGAIFRFPKQYRFYYPRKSSTIREYFLELDAKIKVLKDMLAFDDQLIHSPEDAAIGLRHETLPTRLLKVEKFLRMMEWVAGTKHLTAEGRQRVQEFRATYNALEARVNSGIPLRAVKIIAMVVMAGAWLLDYYRSPHLVLAGLAGGGWMSILAAGLMATILWPRGHSPFVGAFMHALEFKDLGKAQSMLRHVLWNEQTLEDAFQLLGSHALPPDIRALNRKVLVFSKDGENSIAVVNNIIDGERVQITPLFSWKQLPSGIQFIPHGSGYWLINVRDTSCRVEMVPGSSKYWEWADEEIMEDLLED